ncbi:MAG: PAS domain-containing protein [Methanomicrobiales archaeon]|nr:PAS domain-containing protein [Methanomicrobiales archaeon]
MRTVVFCIVLIELFLSLIMILYWKRRRGYPGFGFFALSIFIFTLVHICVLLRGSIPDIISIVGTNLFTILGFLFTYEGASRFTTNKPITASWYLLIPLNCAGMMYGYYYINSLGLRTIFLSIPSCILAFQIARTFFQTREHKKDIFNWLIILNFLILAIIFFFRIIDFGVSIQQRILLESSVSNDFLFIYSLFSAIASSILFITINTDRLAQERDAQIGEIQKLAEKYDLAIKAADVGVWEMNLTTRELTLDDQTTKKLGIERDNNKKDIFSIQELIHPEDLPLVVDKIKTITTEDQEISSEHRLVNKNGEIRYHLSYARSSKSSDGPDLRLVGMSIDVTPLRQAQNSLKTTMKKLSMLSSITRHDILNCTTVIKLSVNLLDNDYRDPQIQKGLLTINAAEEKITNLIRFTGEYEEMGLHDPMWIDIFDILSRHAVMRLIGGIILVKPEKGVQIFVDPMIEKVLYNLIENSIRHGGEVREVSFSYQYEDLDLQIIYTDNGSGIPFEEKEKIFEKGFGKNTGMGLFLCREILALTDIRLIEDGDPGKGARFVMTVRSGFFKGEMKTGKI